MLADVICNYRENAIAGVFGMRRLFSLFEKLTILRLINGWLKTTPTAFIFG